MRSLTRLPRGCAALLAILLLAPTTPAQTPPSPEQALGHPVGADFALVDWDQLRDWFAALAAGSDRVQLLEPGRTTEGRPFLAVVLASPGRLADLAGLKAANRRLADPRGQDEAEQAALVANGPVTLFVSCNMHSTETASPQMAMELAWRWATSEDEPYRSAREHVVVVLLPSVNPDGLEKVVSWYRETVGTAAEGARLTELYHPYAGHDNNRDWFMVSQAETRIVTRLLYEEWLPQVHWDVHEQGQDAERLFVPPFRDPLDPNLDPGVITALGVLGGRMLHDLTAAGLAGVSTGVTYDMWWNGGNRNVPVRHNIPGLLTEAASVDLASPVFLAPDALRPPGELPVYAPSNRFPLPWPGGWWHLDDIVRYELAAAESLLGSLTREPATWRRTVQDAAARSVAEGAGGSPRAWLVPVGEQDIDAVARMADVLLRGGVELQVAEQALSADGRSWPAGSLLVDRAQPYGRYAKDLLELQRYPDGPPPYDVTAWTLPLLLGVRCVALTGPVDGPLRRVTSPVEAVAGFAPGRTRAEGLPTAPLDPGTSAGWRGLLAHLAAGGGLHWPDSAARPEALPEAVAAGRSADLVGLPRVAVYAPWRGEHDEGWTRWALERLGLPYQRLRNAEVRAGRLRERYDAILLPSMGAGTLDEGRAPGTVPERFAGGLDPDGAVALETFVREGGTLVAIERSAEWAADLLGVDLGDALEDSDFACPGAILRAVPGEQPSGEDAPALARLRSRLPGSQPLFFARSRAWEVEPGDELAVLLRYASTRLLLSGWVAAPEVAAGRAAWVRARVGQGVVHLFAFRPFYRGWTQATFGLALRALVFDAPRG